MRTTGELYWIWGRISGSAPGHGSYWGWPAAHPPLRQSAGCSPVSYTHLDSYNVGILIFLVILGTMVCLMNKAGGSAAFGRWAKKNIKSRVGAQLASILLGCLIFIDDYFNCLTVGSVMRPITDKHNVSRAKLAYIIDATAAPVCIIAPISSWAAAVSGFAEDGQGLNLFIRAIPYNFYALLTIVTVSYTHLWPGGAGRSSSRPWGGERWPGCLSPRGRLPSAMRSSS